ncbi:MAG: divalent metal cation transporter [Synoicihabitans sp.]
MAEEPTQLPEDALLEEAQNSGTLRRFSIYSRLSGPGWLQGAVTLGGGSLAGALFLGVLAGPHLLWLQPLAVICGIILLGAIGYVTLSTERQPVETISKHVSPVLAIAWILGTIVANIVFGVPQFALATATVMQNLIPSLNGSASAPWIIGVILAVLGFVVVMQYESGGRGVRAFEMVLKILVGVVVVSFLAVAVMVIGSGQLSFGSVLSGFIPSLSQFTEPTAPLAQAAAATGANEEIWRGIIADQQRDRMIAAAGAAVGINMTFLLPFTLLRRGWTRRHRGLAIFDLSVGLFVPFVVATTCLVIAAGNQFYNRTDDVIAPDGAIIANMAGSYNASADKFLAIQGSDAFKAADSAEAKAMVRAAMPESDRRLAAMLASRDAGQLARTLEPVLGKTGSHLIFGVGVFAMAVSTIIMMGLMNAAAVGALTRKFNDRKIFLIGASMPFILGIFAPVVWTGASKAAFLIPASVTATTLGPIAYFTFLLLMNSKGALGQHQPKGGSRWLWNGLMAFATTMSCLASIWALNNKGFPGQIGLGLLLLLAIFGIAGFIKRRQA